MPVRLDAEAVLRVSDQGGRIVRSESLPARTDLHERWALAHENYARQGWCRRASSTAVTPIPIKKGLRLNDVRSRPSHTWNGLLVIATADSIL